MSLYYDPVIVETIGCDPEVFLQDPEGHIKSAIGLFGGTKEEPAPLPMLGKGFAVQEDNILMEFNIPPANDPESFMNYVQKAMDLLSRRAAVHGLSFAKGSAYSVDKSELMHPNAQVFGCDPDFNAYTGEKNPPPKADDPCLRSAGGHIAFGFNIFNNKKYEVVFGKGVKDNHRRYLVMMADLVLGVASLLVDEGEMRKQLYGKAGAYRPKPFGIEYRTLSNFWLFKPEVIVALLKDYKASVARWDVETLAYTEAVQHANTNGIHKMCQIAINTNDKDFAKWHVKRNNIYFNHSRQYLV